MRAGMAAHHRSVQMARVVSELQGRPHRERLELRAQGRYRVPLDDIRLATGKQDPRVRPVFADRLVRLRTRFRSDFLSHVVPLPPWQRLPGCDRWSWQWT